MAVLPFSEGLCWTRPRVSVGGLGHTGLSLLQQELQPQQDPNSHRHPGRRAGPSPREASFLPFYPGVVVQGNQSIQGDRKCVTFLGIL